jgi:uncharacterized protein (DUF2141 family)
MKIATHPRYFCWLLLLVVAIAKAGAQTTPSTKVTISGRVLGGSGEHTIYVALWDEKGFPQHPVEQISTDPRQSFEFRFVVAPGRWAVSAFEDENGNKILDMGLFGPKEPSGFWRAFHGWHKPRFSEVCASIDHDTPDADIHLGK